MKKSLTVLSLVFVASGCAYKAETDINPATDIYSNYSEKIKGRYALYVDAEEMRAEVRVSGLTCAAYNFPVDAREEFKISVERTFENIFEDIDVVSNPLGRTEIQSGKLDGMIVVRVSDFDVELRFISRFFSTDADADTEITANTVIDGLSGRVLGTNIEGSDDYATDAGIACEGGAIAVGKSVEMATKKTLEKLGERLVNSPRLR